MLENTLSSALFKTSLSSSLVGTFASPCWELTVQTTGASEAYSLDINSGTDIDVTINWGDGTITNYNSTGIKSNTYASAGTYSVRVYGTMTAGNIRQDSTGTYANAPKVKATSAIIGITGWSKFESTFRNTRITTLPADTFKIHTAVSSAGFFRTFSGCTSLTTIPTDLFRYNTAVSIDGFYQTFYNCTSLTTIPTDLFRYNTAVSSGGFIGTFFGCTSLTTIPTDTFRYNTSVSASGFNATFNGCTSLTSIPTDLFRYNTAVSTSGFREAFRNCTSLTTIPTDLFRYNTAASSDGFKHTFYGCVKLQMIADVFGDLSVLTTRFTNKVSDFESFFQIGAAFTGTQGIAPPLWDADFGTETPTITNAFTGHDAASLSNYATIPNGWKGL